MGNPMAHPIPHPIRDKGEGRREKGERSPTVDPLAIYPSLPSTRTTYETPTPDRLADLERANADDGELIHECVWRAKAAHQRIANRRAEIDRLREAA